MTRIITIIILWTITLFSLTWCIDQIPDIKSPNFEQAYNQIKEKISTTESNELIQNLNKKIIKAKDNAGLYIQRAKVKIQIGNFQEGIQDLTQSIKIDPQNADAYQERGNAKYHIKDYEGMCEDLKKAFDLGGDQTIGEYLKNTCQKFFNK